VAPGSAFYAPGWIRLSYAMSLGKLKEAMGRIRELGNYVLSRSFYSLIFRLRLDGANAPNGRLWRLHYVYVLICTFKVRPKKKKNSLTRSSALLLNW